MREYHALLAPSSAARWLKCPPSARLGEGEPEKTSTDAEKGRLAHAIAELKARKKFFPLSKKTYTSQLNKLQSDPLYEKVMDGYTDQYVEVLTEHAMSFKSQPFIALETQVPIGLITGETKEDGSPATGTADCIQIGDGVLWVTDYKNGSGIPVSAVENPQMMLYGLAALILYRPLFGDTIHTVRTTIVQPALNSVSDWEISRAELETWGRDKVAPIAALALKGEGELNPGEWCKSHFCPVRHKCRALANSALSLEEFKLSLPSTLSPSEIGNILERGELLVSWYNDVKEYGLKEILAGHEIPGWKAVEGRGGREWTGGVDATFPALIAAGLEEALLWERKPVTPPALEKVVGKKVYEEVVKPHVTKVPGKPTLAPESDKRPAYNPAVIAFATTNNE